MDNPKFLTELEVKIRDMLTELESESIDGKARDLFDKFKIIAYKLALKRYLTSFKILSKIEEKIENALSKEDEEIPTDVLISFHKTLTKSIDILNSQIRFLFPAKLPEDLQEEYSEINNIELDEENEAIGIRKILYSQIKDMLKAIKKVRKDMETYDNQSLEYWKAQNSYIELNSKLIDLIARLDKLNEADKDNEVQLTMEEILEVYEELEEIENKEEKEIEEEWKKQTSQSS